MAALADTRLFFCVFFLGSFSLDTVTCSPNKTTNSSVNISANPTTVIEGFTKYISINCTHSHDLGSDFGTVMSLILSKTSSPQSTDYKEVASISSFHQYDVNIDDTSLGGDAKGQLLPTGQSFVSITWTYPSTRVVGRYKCEAFGMDDTGHPKTSSAIADILEGTVDLDAVLEKMKGMDARQDLLLTELKDLKEFKANSTAELEAFKANSTAELEDFKANSRAQLEALKTTSATEIGSLKAQQASMSAVLDTCRIELEALTAYKTNTTARIINTEYQLLQLETCSANASALLHNVRAELDALTVCEANTTTLVNNNQAELTKLRDRQDNCEEKLVNVTSRLDNVKASITLATSSHRGHTYHLSYKSHLSPLVGNAMCGLFGAYLVEINDKDEFDFLGRFLLDNDVRRDAWVGAMDKGHNNSWTYMTSGDPVSYFQWLSDSHNSSSYHDARCMKLYYATSNEVSKWGMQPYYCFERFDTHHLYYRNPSTSIICESSD